MPYSGSNLANQNGWKLGVFDWKLEGTHFVFVFFLSFFFILLGKMKQ